MDTSIDQTSTSNVMENKTIYLVGIPPHLNTVMNLKNHYSKFASDMTVELSYNRDPGAAAITFTNDEMAITAFNDSKVILESASIKKSFHPPHAVSTSKSTSSSSSAPKYIGFECKLCGNILASQSSLEAHIERMHTNVICEICEETFNSKQSYRKHYNTEHTTNVTAVNGEGEITPRTLTLPVALSDAESDEVHPTSTSESVSATIGASTTSALSKSTAIPIAIAATTSSASTTDAISISTSVKRKNRDVADPYPHPHPKKCLKTHVEPDSSRSQKIVAQPDNQSEERNTVRSLKLEIIALKRDKSVAFQEISDLRTELKEATCSAEKAERAAARANDQTKRLFDFSKVQDAKLTKNKQELADRDHDLAEKEHELAQKDQLLNLKCEDIANLTDSLKDKDASLAGKDKKIADLTHKYKHVNVLVAQQKQQIAELEAEMYRLRDIITGNDANHAAQMQSLVNILQERDGTIMQFQQWLHEEQHKFYQIKANLEHRLREKEHLLANVRVENIELNHKVDRLRDVIKDKNKTISEQPKPLMDVKLDFSKKSRNLNEHFSSL